MKTSEKYEAALNYEKKVSETEISGDVNDAFVAGVNYAEQQIKELEEDLAEALRFVGHRGFCDVDSCGCGLNELLDKQALKI